MKTNETQSSQFRQEVRKGRRFRFGANWRRFLSVLNEERIGEAESSLRDYLEAETLKGARFVDVGSGSGLFSLAARRLGAEVFSFDYDPDSVACTKELKRRYFPGDAKWTVVGGSILDNDFLTTLGRYDIVYAWGVLHHTGELWRALSNTMNLVKPGGKLYIAIYNDCGKISRMWLGIKKTYNALPGLLRPFYAIAVWTPIELRQLIHSLWNDHSITPYLDRWREYKKSRGMSRIHDMIDWIGGYPYEFSSAERLVSFVEKEGFAVNKLVPNNGYGNHQIVFSREAVLET